METTRDLAIVLRSVRFEDRHRIVTALTERHGKISAMARNAVQSRRFGGCLEPFAASEWTFVSRPGSDLSRLDGAVIREDFPGLRADFTRVAVASLFCEFTIRLAPANEACPDLFKLLSNALAAVEELPDPSGSGPLVNSFLAKLMQWSGVQPHLHGCLECLAPLDAIAGIENDPDLACLVKDAGWICPRCRTTTVRHVRQTELGAANLIDVPASAMLDLYTGARIPIRQVRANSHATGRAHQTLSNFLTGLLAYHVPGFDRSELKSLRFLTQSSD
ncbi:MAG: DNA repair protein RecO [Bdellovibrionales bacterium]|nr:DNA repair protein RecO [Bdellovibrionales bacterium]